MCGCHPSLVLHFVTLSTLYVLILSFKRVCVTFHYLACINIVPRSSFWFKITGNGTRMITKESLSFVIGMERRRISLIRISLSGKGSSSGFKSLATAKNRSINVNMFVLLIIPLSNLLLCVSLHFSSRYDTCGLKLFILSPFSSLSLTKLIFPAPTQVNLNFPSSEIIWSPLNVGQWMG